MPHAPIRHVRCAALTAMAHAAPHRRGPWPLAPAHPPASLRPLRLTSRPLPDPPQSRSLGAVALNYFASALMFLEAILMIGACQQVSLCVLGVNTRVLVCWCCWLCSASALMFLEAILMMGACQQVRVHVRRGVFHSLASVLVGDRSNRCFRRLPARPAGVLEPAPHQDCGGAAAAHRLRLLRGWDVPRVCQACAVTPSTHDIDLNLHCPRYLLHSPCAPPVPVGLLCCRLLRFQRALTRVQRNP